MSGSRRMVVEWSDNGRRMVDEWSLNGRRSYNGRRVVEKWSYSGPTPVEWRSFHSEIAAVTNTLIPWTYSTEIMNSIQNSWILTQIYTYTSEVAIGCVGVQCIRPQRCRGQTFTRRSLQDESPKSAENCFCVNTFLATVDRTCTQIKERFLSMNSVTMAFWILFPSKLFSASDDKLYAPAESPAKQYDTDISPAFSSQLLSFRSCFHSPLSTKSTTLKVSYYWSPCTFFHVQWCLYGLHAVADVVLYWQIDN